MTLVPGIIVFVFGAVWFAIRRLEQREDRRFSRTGVRISGTVVELMTFPNEDDLQTGQHRLLVEYSLGGCTYTVKSRHGRSTWGHEIGKEHAILVDPNDPEKARLEIDIRIGVSSWGYLLIAAAGLVLILAEFFAERT